jgi:hypothetical protein
MTDISATLLEEENMIQQGADAHKKHNLLPNFKDNDLNTSSTDTLHKSGEIKSTYDTTYSMPGGNLTDNFKENRQESAINAESNGGDHIGITARGLGVAK